jgi:hypothetical protein
MTRMIIGVGCLTVAVLALFPPVRRPLDATRRERAFLFSQFVTTGDPVAPREVDAGRLLAEVLLVAGCVGALCAFLGPQPRRADPGTASPKEPA